MNKVFEIGGRKVGVGQPAFVIAELSANHNGSFESAVKLIREAKRAGADAVKLQTYTAETITIDCDNEYFQIKQGTLWDGRTLFDLYKEAYTPWEWHPKLMEVAREEGLICFSSPFDKTAVDFLEELNVPAYKVASFEITDIPLIEYIASKGKPVIMATGISNLGDIQEAVNACLRMGNDKIALLKCTSAYPAKLEDANIKTIPNLESTFDVIAGLSDHTMGITVPLAAVALGAKIVEKHFTLSRADGGPDAAFSLECDELGEMVRCIRDTEKALGKIHYSLTENTLKSREFSRSLFVVEDIKAGEEFTAQNVRSIRPGFGLPPKYLKDILGKKASVDISRGTPMDWKHIE